MAQSNTRQRASASTGQYRHVCEGGAVNAIRVSSGLFLLGVACVSGPDPDETGFVSGGPVAGLAQTAIVEVFRLN